MNASVNNSGTAATAQAVAPEVQPDLTKPVALRDAELKRLADVMEGKFAAAFKRLDTAIAADTETPPKHTAGQYEQVRNYLNTQLSTVRRGFFTADKGIIDNPGNAEKHAEAIKEMATLTNDLGPKLDAYLSGANAGDFLVDTVNGTVNAAKEGIDVTVAAIGSLSDDIGSMGLLGALDKRRNAFAKQAEQAIKGLNFGSIVGMLLGVGGAWLVTSVFGGVSGIFGMALFALLAGGMAWMGHDMGKEHIQPMIDGMLGGKKDQASQPNQQIDRSPGTTVQAQGAVVQRPFTPDPEITAMIVGLGSKRMEVADAQPGAAPLRVQVNSNQLGNTIIYNDKLPIDLTPGSANVNVRTSGDQTRITIR